MAQIDFEITQDGLTYRDAIHLEDGHTYSTEEIEAMKQQRFDSWKAFLDAAALAAAEAALDAAPVLPESPELQVPVV